MRHIKHDESRSYLEIIEYQSNEDMNSFGEIVKFLISVKGSFREIKGKSKTLCRVIFFNRYLWFQVTFQRLNFYHYKKLGQE